MPPDVVRRGIIAAFGLAVLLGALLAIVGGWPIIVIGVLSLLSGLAYTGGPRPFGYHGLGDVFVFVFFGMVAVTGTAYLQMGEWSPFAMALAVPVGLLVTNILVVNNLRDIDTDRAAAKRTLAVRIGDRATRMQYLIFAAVAYLIPLALAAADPSRRLLLLPLLSLPLAITLVRQVVGGVGGRDLNPILGRTAGLLLVFGLLLALGAALSG
jgi:1,4-dihydroxy-2-naphthoate octaprenyltransferase